MRIVLIFSLAFWLLVGCIYESSAEDAPLVQDPLLWTAEATLAADWLQTRQIALHPEKYYEINPLIGPHPSQGLVNSYFALCALAEYKSASYLPKREREWFLLALTSMEASYVAHNWRVGLRIGF